MRLRVMAVKKNEKKRCNLVIMTDCGAFTFSHLLISESVDWFT